MTNEDLLKEFYKAYAAWLWAGAPADASSRTGVRRYEPTKDVFSRSCGLCHNVWHWLRSRGEAPKVCILQRLMAQQFIDAGLDCMVPFTVDGARYDLEVDTHSCHLNATRIQWVLDHAD